MHNTRTHTRTKFIPMCWTVHGVVYSHEAAGGGARHRWVSPLPVPPERWAGTWSRIVWGWVQVPHPAETADWWWWWTQTPRPRPRLEEEKKAVFILDLLSPCVLGLNGSQLHTNSRSLDCCLNAFFPQAGHMWRKTSSKGFQSTSPCDDTWCLQQETWSDISAELCSPHFSSKAADVGHEAGEESERYAII